ncbi:UPF0235 protein C15orf40 homolog isoform X1 [Poecilia reticulata]|uniref:UPF0235 protein C15orf40 homolog isoform X1 n=1 Tax=Poecilia reticulata TaxID=8081 RepID=UPI0004A4C8C1|nr:PREDICTED: UPF0235 protein C15orf40 homolog isoform X1 [Poecilia reticulata]
MFPRFGGGLIRCFKQIRFQPLTRVPAADLVPVFICSSWSTRWFSRTTAMPRKQKEVKGQVKGQVKAAVGGTTETPDSGPVTRDKTGSVSITVHAKPGSKHSSITDVSSQAVGVSIAAPPTDGEANTELVRYLAEVLELKKSQISLDKGSRSRDKVIKVDSSLDPEEVLKRLRQAAS